MSKKIVWTIESFTGDHLYGIFSTKGKAIEAIKTWAHGLNPYVIETNTDMIPRLDGKPATINIRYDRNRRMVSLYVHKLNFNNGAGIIHAFRHNFGEDHEGEGKKDN